MTIKYKGYTDGWKKSGELYVKGPQSVYRGTEKPTLERVGFDPTVVTNLGIPLSIFGDDLEVWLDLNDTDTLFQDVAGTIPANLGDPIGLVTDKSTKGRDFSQVTEIRRPLVSDAGLNGNVSALMDGSDDYFVNNAFPSIAVPRTVIVVIEDDGTEGVITWSTDNADYGIVNFSVTGNTRLFNGAAAITSAGSPDSTSWILEFESTSGLETIRVNNDIGKVDAAGNAATGLEYRIGVNPAFARYFASYVGEFIMVNRALSSQERTTLYDYLTLKWNIS